jgi:CheY-like chemotaxis protein
LLEEIGCTVTGPVSDLNEALQVARAGSFDAAVLDVNLGGAFAYPLAEMLHANAVPFVFLTGYTPDALDERFKTAPVLRKPIEKEALETALRTAVACAAHEKPLRVRQ